MSATFSMQDFKDIRKLYESDSDRSDPYWFVDISKLSPIERMLWGDIRTVGLYGFMMQYPIGRYFADFANPKKRIVIEADGKGFHQDWRKDDARQKEIEAMGWTVYRLTGSAIMRDTDHLIREHFGRKYDDYFEIPREEREEFNRLYRFSGGEIFCEWLRDTHY